MKNFKYYFLKALGYEEVPEIAIEANIRLRKPFFICKDGWGDASIMPCPEGRNRLFAEIMGSRLKYSKGKMVWYDGRDFVLVTWENWKQVFAMLAPLPERKVYYAIAERGPRRTVAEQMFEDGRTKRADLPKLMRSDQIMVLLEA